MIKQRVCLIGLFVFLFIFVVYSGDTTYLNSSYSFCAYYDDIQNPGFKFSLSGNKLYLEIPELDEGKNESGIYIKKVIRETYYIKDDGAFRYIITPSSKYMVFTNGKEVCILLNCNTGESFWGVLSDSQYVRIGSSPKSTFIGIRGGMTDYQKNSSCLVETIKGKTTKYDGLSNYYYDLLVPWVEGRPDYGVGEWLQKTIVYRTTKVIFINGFIDRNHPDLYWANSRVKRIRIQCDSGSWSYDILDTPDVQILNLPTAVSGNIRFIIEDVYKGTKYSDTSIAAIYFLEEAPLK